MNIDDNWKDKFRSSLHELKNKSDDDFEKYITYISAGGLGLTLTFINDIVPLSQSTGRGFIFIGWVSLAITLFINLCSHYKSSKNAQETLNDIDDDIPYENLLKNMTERNNIINCLNLTTLFTLGIGILAIIIFVVINSYI